MERKFTGWHMLAMMVAFFGVIIAVNITMARIAIGTFGGVVVENSYIATERFNGWLEQAEAQEKLGWEISPALDADRHVAVTTSQTPDALLITGWARHPLGVADERQLVFAREADGSFRSTDALPEGRWVLRISASADGHEWRSEEEL